MRTTQAAIDGPDFSSILVTLGAFLCDAEREAVYYGGYSGKEALDALQQLLGWDDEQMAAFVAVFTD